MLRAYAQDEISLEADFSLRMNKRLGDNSLIRLDLEGD